MFINTKILKNTDFSGFLAPRCFFYPANKCLRPSQQFFHLCRDGSSWVEPVLSKDKCVLLKENKWIFLLPATLLINVKMPTIVGILTFMSRIKFYQL